MTTQQFIQKTIGTESSRDRQCSSVFTDRQGVVYSYGWHYPLARIVDGVAFVNTKPYSSTTARHSAWARQACAERVGSANVYSVPLTNGNAMTLAGLLESAERHAQDLTEQMAAKKRKDTQVYWHLEYQRDNAIKALLAVKDLMKQKGIN